jgi:hypothetical protein
LEPRTRAPAKKSNLASTRRDDAARRPTPYLSRRRNQRPRRQRLLLTWTRRTWSTRTCTLLNVPTAPAPPPAPAGTKLRKCAGCRISAYCSGACQRADWAGACTRSLLSST